MDRLKRLEQLDVMGFLDNLEVTVAELENELDDMRARMANVKELMTVIRDKSGDALTILSLHKAQILKLRAQLKVLSGMKPAG